MAKKNLKSLVGRWAFLIGLIVAVLVGLFPSGLNNPLIISVLVIIGLVVGLLNITEEETTPFLMSGAVLIIASSFGKDVMGIVPILDNILGALLVLFVPATIIVAVRNVFSLAKN